MVPAQLQHPSLDRRQTSMHPMAAAHSAVSPQLPACPQAPQMGLGPSLLRAVCIQDHQRTCQASSIQRTAQATAPTPRTLRRAAALPSARLQRRSCRLRASQRRAGSWPQHASRRQRAPSTRQTLAQPRATCCRRTCSRCPRCQAAPSRRCPRPPAGHTARRASQAAQELPRALNLALAIVCQVKLSRRGLRRMRGMRRPGLFHQPQALSSHQCQAPSKHH